MSKIEQIISEIEEYIDGCKFQPLSNTKIIVNKDEIDELLAELRLRTPEEIKKYQKIINNKDAILNDAKQKADVMLEQAITHKDNLVSEHEIMQQAYAQANDMLQQTSDEAQDILDKAVADANDIRSAAVSYIDSELANLEKVVSHMIDNMTMRYENFMNAMTESLQVIRDNRSSLNPVQEEETNMDVMPDIPDEAINNDMAEYEDYTVNFDDEM